MEDLQAQILGLPLPQSPATVAKQVELEKLGTELWNASTRLRRGLSQMSDRSADEVSRKSHTLGLLRVFSFLLLDAAGSQSVKGREGKNCFRLMKIAHKAAKWCIQAKEVGNATKVLERAAEYQEISGQEDEVELTEFGLGERLQVEYFALRTALVSVFPSSTPKVYPCLGQSLLTFEGLEIGPNGYSRAHVCQVQRTVAFLHGHTYRASC